MEYRHAAPLLRRLDEETHFTAGLAPAVVKAFRKRMQLIRAAVDERDFYCLKSLHFEKLKGRRSRQRSMILNDQWRLILELEDSPRGSTIVIVRVEDYHS